MSIKAPLTEIVAALDELAAIDAEKVAERERVAAEKVAARERVAAEKAAECERLYRAALTHATLAGPKFASRHGRPNERTLIALSLIGEVRENGRPHNAYSAALAAGALPCTVYRALAVRRKKAPYGITK